MDQTNSCLCDSSEPTDPTEYLESLKRKYFNRTIKLQAQQQELEKKIMKMEAFIGRSDEPNQLVQSICQCDTQIPKVFPQAPVRDVSAVNKTMTSAIQNQQPVTQQCSFFQKMMENAMSILSMKCQCTSAFTSIKSTSITPATVTDTATTTINTTDATSSEPPTRDNDYSIQQNVVDYENILTDKSSRTSTCSCDITEPSTLQEVSCSCNITDGLPKTVPQSQQVSIDPSSSSPKEETQERQGSGRELLKKSVSKSERGCPWKNTLTSELISGQCSCDTCMCDSSLSTIDDKDIDMENAPLENIDMENNNVPLPTVSVFSDKADNTNAEVQVAVPVENKGVYFQAAKASKCVTCCRIANCPSNKYGIGKGINLNAGIQVASVTRSRGINIQIPKDASNMGVSCCQLKTCPNNIFKNYCNEKCKSPTCHNRRAGPDSELKGHDQVIQVCPAMCNDADQQSPQKYQDGQNQCAFIGSPLLNPNDVAVVDRVTNRATSSFKIPCDCNQPQGARKICQTSVFSLNSNNIADMQNIAELAYIEKEIKANIEELQKREKQYQQATRNIESLVRRTNNPCCSCEKSASAHMNVEVEKISKELLLENQILKSDLEDIKLELKHCLEKIEGPMKQKLQTEKLKCEHLQKELQDASKSMMISQDSYAREMNQLKLQLCCACTNITELNQMNQRLKDEMRQLECICQKLEDDLLKQKVNEAETIKRLTCRKFSGDTPFKQQSEEFKCDSSLDVIARKLSKTLKDLSPCEECSKLPSELAGAARCIKDLTDMVRKRRLKASSKSGCNCRSKPPSRPPSKTFAEQEECCSCCGPRDGGGESARRVKSPEEKIVKTLLPVIESFGQKEDSSKFDVGGAQSSYYSAKGEPVRESPCAKIGTPCVHSKGTLTKGGDPSIDGGKLQSSSICEPCKKVSGPYVSKDKPVQVPFSLDKGCKAPCSEIMEPVRDQGVEEALAPEKYKAQEVKPVQVPEKPSQVGKDCKPLCKGFIKDENDEEDLEPDHAKGIPVAVKTEPPSSTLSSDEKHISDKPHTALEEPLEATQSEVPVEAFTTGSVPSASQAADSAIGLKTEQIVTDVLPSNSDERSSGENQKKTSHDISSKSTADQLKQKEEEHEVRLAKISQPIGAKFVKEEPQTEGLLETFDQIPSQADQHKLGSMPLDITQSEVISKKTLSDKLQEQSEVTRVPLGSAVSPNTEGRIEQHHEPESHEEMGHDRVAIGMREIPFEEKRMGGEFPFEVGMKAFALDDPPTGLHMTTTITGSGTLEVITEGPLGIIETTLTYTEEGNIEVITEMAEQSDEHSSPTDYALEKFTTTPPENVSIPDSSTMPCSPGATCHSMGKWKGMVICDESMECYDMVNRTKPIIKAMNVESSFMSGPSGPEIDTPYTASSLTADTQLTSKIGSSFSGIKPATSRTPDLTSGYALSSVPEMAHEIVIPYTGSSMTADTELTSKLASSSSGIKPGFSKTPDLTSGYALSSLPEAEPGHEHTQETPPSAETSSRIGPTSSDRPSEIMDRKSEPLDQTDMTSDSAADSGQRKAEAVDILLSEEATSTAGELRSGEVFTPDQIVSDLEMPGQIKSEETSPKPSSPSAEDASRTSAKASEVNGKSSVQSEPSAGSQHLVETSVGQSSPLDEIIGEGIAGTASAESEKVETVTSLSEGANLSNIKGHESEYEDQVTALRIKESLKKGTSSSGQVEGDVALIGSMAPETGQTGPDTTRECACQSKNQADQSCQCCECKTVGITTSGDKETITEKEETMGKITYETLDGTKTDTDSEFVTISEATDIAVAQTSTTTKPGDTLDELSTLPNVPSTDVQLVDEAKLQDPPELQEKTSQDQEQILNKLDFITPTLATSSHTSDEFPEINRPTEEQKHSLKEDTDESVGIHPQLSGKSKEEQIKILENLGYAIPKEITISQDLLKKHSLTGSLQKGLESKSKDNASHIPQDIEYKYSSEKHPQIVSKVKSEQQQEHPELPETKLREPRSILRDQESTHFKPTQPMLADKSSKEQQEIPKSMVHKVMPENTLVSSDKFSLPISKSVSFEERALKKDPELLSKSLDAQHRGLAPQAQSVEVSKELLEKPGYPSQGNASDLTDNKSADQRPILPKGIPADRENTLKAFSYSKPVTEADIKPKISSDIGYSKSGELVQVSREILEKHPELKGKSFDEQTEMLESMGYILGEIFENALSGVKSEKEIIGGSLDYAPISDSKFSTPHPSSKDVSVTCKASCRIAAVPTSPDVLERPREKKLCAVTTSYSKKSLGKLGKRPSSKEVSVACTAPCKSATTIHSPTQKCSEKSIIPICDVSSTCLSKSRSISLQKKPSARDDSATCKASCRAISVQSSKAKLGQHQKEFREIVAARTDSTTTSSSSDDKQRKRKSCKSRPAEVPHIVSELSDKERPTIESTKRPKSSRKRRTKAIDCMKCTCEGPCNCVVCVPGRRKHAPSRSVISCDCPSPNLMMVPPMFVVPPMQMTYSMPPTGHAANCKCNACIYRESTCKADVTKRPEADSPISDETDGHSKKSAKHPPTCECIDCLCLPKVKNLARTKECPIVYDTKQVYQVKVKCDTCVNAQNARRYVEQQQNRSRIPISTTTSNPPRVRSDQKQTTDTTDTEVQPVASGPQDESSQPTKAPPLSASNSMYHSVACDCPNCVCSDCPDETKHQTKQDVADCPKSETDCCCKQIPCVCQPCTVQELTRKLKEAEEKLAAAQTKAASRPSGEALPSSGTAPSVGPEGECNCAECTCPRSDLMPGKMGKPKTKAPSVIKSQAGETGDAKPPEGGEEQCTCVECVCPGKDSFGPSKVAPEKAPTPVASVEAAKEEPPKTDGILEHPSDCICPECTCPGVVDLKKTQIEKQPSVPKQKSAEKTEQPTAPASAGSEDCTCTICECPGRISLPPKTGTDTASPTSELKMESCDCKDCKCGPCADPNMQATKSQPPAAVIADCDCVDCKCSPCADPKKRKELESRIIDQKKEGENLDECDCISCQCLGAEPKKKVEETKTEKEEHPEDCDCPECACPGTTAKVEDIPSKISKATDMPEKVPHPPDCDCDECFCLEEIIRSETVGSVEKGVQPLAEKSVHAQNCVCPVCACLECITRSIHAIGCQCEKCLCDTCDKKASDVEKVKSTQVGDHEIHSPECTCIKCACDVCTIPKKEKLVKIDDLATHEDGCKCDECLCKEECFMKLTTAKLDEGCQCVKCVCVECVKKMQQGDQGVVLTSSALVQKEVGRAVEGGVEKEVERGSNCLCTQCLCIKCKATNGEMRSIEESRPRILPIERGEGEKHGDGCTCPTCTCSECTEDKDSDVPCVCPECTCDRCKNRTLQLTRKDPSTEKPVEHSPECDCPICKCPLSSQITEVTETPSPNGDQCSCSDCQCKPCFRKTTQEDPCTCPVCACLDCPRTREVGKTSQSPLPIQKSSHEDQCRCSICQCKPCFKKPVVQEECMCKVCLCIECPKKRRESVKEMEKHSLTCTCPICQCAGEKPEQVDQSDAQEAKFAQEPKLAGEVKSDEKRVLIDPPPFEPYNRIDCNCQICGCIICESHKTGVQQIGTVFKTGESQSRMPDDYVPPPFEVPVRIDCICNRCSCLFCNKEGPSQKSVAAQPSVAFSTGPSQKSVAAQPSLASTTADKKAVSVQPSASTTADNPAAVVSSTHQEGCLCEYCICRQPCKQDERKPVEPQVSQLIAESQHFAASQPGHPKGCRCEKCTCDPCKFGGIPGYSYKQTAESEHVATNQLGQVGGSPTNIYKLTTASLPIAISQLEHPEGCRCENCTCDPNKLGAGPHLAEQTTTSEHKTSSQVGHPKECRCEKCTCDPCKFGGSPSIPYKEAAANVHTTTNQVEHPKGCCCAKCTCDPCKFGGSPSTPYQETAINAHTTTSQLDHPEGCRCENCTCDPSKFGGSPSNLYKETAANVHTTTSPLGQLAHSETAANVHTTTSPLGQLAHSETAANVHTTTSPLGHPKGCRCEKCTCEPCKLGGSPSHAYKVDESFAIAKGSKLMEETKLSKTAKPEGVSVHCNCPTCTCDEVSANEKPPSVQPLATNTAASVTPSVHPDGCVCETCICQPCKQEPSPASQPTGASSHTATGQPGHPKDCPCEKCICDPCKFGKMSSNTYKIQESFVSAKGSKPAAEVELAEKTKAEDIPLHCYCPTCTCGEGIINTTKLDKSSTSPTTAPSTSLPTAAPTVPSEVYQSVETLVLPKPDIRKMYQNHPVACDCLPCKCERCADPNIAEQSSKPLSNVKFSGPQIKESVKTMDNVALVKSIQAASRENCECKEQIEEIKRALEKIKCACYEAEFRSTQSIGQTMNKDIGPIGAKPFVKQASAFGQTMSGLKMALNNLQAKCKAKDRMIEAMTAELSERVTPDLFDKVLDVSVKIPAALDYDQAEDVKSLDRSQLTTNVIYPPTQVKDEGTIASDLKNTASKCVEVRSHKHKKKKDKSSDKKPIDDCACSKPQLIQKQEKDCQKIDLTGFEVIDIRRITDDSLIVKWNAPNNEQVHGYDIYLNGKLATKVMSGTRTSAMMHSLDLSKSVQITLYAITKCGRVEPPAIAIYEIKS